MKKSLLPRWKNFGGVRFDNKIVRFIYVTYESAHELTWNFYADDSASADLTGTLAVSSSIITQKIKIKYRCKTFIFGIVDSASGTTDAEIHKIEIRDQ